MQQLIRERTSAHPDAYRINAEGKPGLIFTRGDIRGRPNTAAFQKERDLLIKGGADKERAVTWLKRKIQEQQESLIQGESTDEGSD